MKKYHIRKNIELGIETTTSIEIINEDPDAIVKSINLGVNIYPNRYKVTKNLSIYYDPKDTNINTLELLSLLKTANCSMHNKSWEITGYQFASLPDMEEMDDINKALEIVQLIDPIPDSALKEVAKAINFLEPNNDQIQKKSGLERRFELYWQANMIEKSNHMTKKLDQYFKELCGGSDSTLIITDLKGDADTLIQVAKHINSLNKQLETKNENKPSSPRLFN